MIHVTFVIMREDCNGNRFGIGIDLFWYVLYYATP